MKFDKNTLDYKLLWEVFWQGYYARSLKARKRYYDMFLKEFIATTVYNNKS